MYWYITPSVFLMLILLVANLLTTNIILVSLVLVFLIVKKMMTLSQQRSQFDVVSSEFKNGFIYSPITGVIKEIKIGDSASTISLHSNFYLPTTVGMPLNGEILDLSQVKGRSNSILMSNNIKLEIKAKHLILKMNVQMSKFQHLNNNLRAGDIGQAGAAISILPAFGTLEIIIPKKYTLNVKLGDKVKFGSTPLATWE